MSPRKKAAAKENNSSLELMVLSTAGKEVEKVNLDPQVFDGKVNHQLMNQAVVAYLANQRKGLANTKTRGEVSGGGRKPWKQKGTGRARVGSTRSPLWKGGGVSFGPKPHSFHKDLPKQMKIQALKSALNAKLKDAEISIVDAFKIATHKTKDFAAILNNLKLNGTKLMLVINNPDNNLRLSSRNIPRLFIQHSDNLTTYEALNCKQLVFAKDALQALTARIKKGLQ